uniref:Glycosyltransferase subfamily 4-like N-terminal domain-containing protein n=1 Tax=Chromera velia CCMP2878 TaxID=1169474 RepID=A0A0G4H4D0_9ALVE|eukprot:Cvel_24652.t1-p1 / transcript=Cvel_24652.t1 / gene=Cvel_24652 / organism=Chromera_velia_CCMP2878 / gene_product=GDP-mannose-dependent alpha-mannosyltransferase, putative / transcript_product=GDP-mannose-dependent alpha-mannosyltransferase, putative / location=Cvel_scaffold2694:223-5390(+) / protein_length=630 / sequence_SO=supercontig / SO=protein_coding / is_pseudo=false
MPVTQDGPTILFSSRSAALRDLLSLHLWLSSSLVHSCICSGYANRFQEMLKHLRRSRDKVSVLTVDAPEADTQPAPATTQTAPSDPSTSACSCARRAEGEGETGEREGAKAEEKTQQNETTQETLTGPPPEAAVSAPDRTPLPLSESDAPATWEGIPVHHTPGFVFPFYKHIKVSLDLPHLLGLRLLKRERPDILHVSSPGTLVVTAALLYARMLRDVASPEVAQKVARAAGRRVGRLDVSWRDRVLRSVGRKRGMRGLPLVLSYHTHLPVYARNYLGWVPGVEWASWAVIRSIHNLADLTLTTSPQLKQQLVERGVKRVDVWQKGVDVEVFDPRFKSEAMRRRLLGLKEGEAEEGPLLLYVGRLGAEKRLKELKAVLMNLRESGVKARLAIVGKGPQGEELREFFADTPTVFTGPLSGQMLSEAFASADVFVMPSDSETLGFVVLESMASGVPVVGVNAGGVPSLISSGTTGVIVEDPDDFGTFTEEVRRLCVDSEGRAKMAIAAREEAVRWGWAASMERLRTDQYDQAIRSFVARRAKGSLRLPARLRLLRLKFFALLSGLSRKKESPVSSTDTQQQQQEEQKDEKTPTPQKQQIQEEADAGAALSVDRELAEITKQIAQARAAAASA